MTINKASQQKYKPQRPKDNPLTDIAGKFGGEFWLETQSEIEKARKIDKEETEKNSDSESKEQD